MGFIFLSPPAFSGLPILAPPTLVGARGFIAIPDALFTHSTASFPSISPPNFSTEPPEILRPME